MFSRIADFEMIWSQEIESTQKIFKHITNASLNTKVTPEHRSLQRIAWHIVVTIPEMLGGVGLQPKGPAKDAPMPTTAGDILKSFNEAAISLLDEIKTTWSDETLQQTDMMYGREWKRGYTLMALVLHQTHHRGQLTVLMRQSGLDVPGAYGPAKQEWVMFGMRPPEI